MSDLLPDNPPTPENGYAVDSAMEMTAALWNHILSSIHERLAAREELEADFEALIAEGTSAALTMVQENVAPQLAALQDSIAASQAAIEEMMSGTAPNAARLGNQLPDYYLAPANFSVSATVKALLAAADAIGVHDVIGTGVLLASLVSLTGTQQIVGHKRFTSNGPIATPSGAATMLEAYSTSGANAAMIAFHRAGAHAVYFGLDTDNELKFGGWSRGANAYKIWHEANFNPSSYMPLGGGALSPGAIIQYHAEVGEKVRLYGGSYGVGVQSGELTLWGSISAALRFRQGGLTGTILGELTTSGFKLPSAAPTDNLHATSKQYVDARGAKAWVNFNGTETVAIRSAHNVSSITDLGVGIYQVNFATPMANANYCALAQSVRSTTAQIQYQATVNDYLTTSLTVRTAADGTTSHSPTDNIVVCVAVFGG